MAKTYIDTRVTPWCSRAELKALTKRYRKRGWSVVQIEDRGRQHRAIMEREKKIRKSASKS